MTMDEAQWRQDADGSWRYLAGDGTWCTAGSLPSPANRCVGHDPAPRRNRLGIVGVALGILAGGIGGLSVSSRCPGSPPVHDSRGGQIGIRWAVAGIVVGIASVVATATILGVVLLRPSQPPSPSAQAVESSLQPEPPARALRRHRHCNRGVRDAHRVGTRPDLRLFRREPIRSTNWARSRQDAAHSGRRVGDQPSWSPQWIAMSFHSSAPGSGWSRGRSERQEVQSTSRSGGGLSGGAPRSTPVTSLTWPRNQTVNSSSEVASSS